MAIKVKIRPQKISDAKRFFEILNNDNFVYFPTRPKSLREEIEYLKKNTKRKANNFQHNFSILYGTEVVGACGLRVDQHRGYIGEIGYFVDEKYWGKGIATEAVRLVEKFGFEKLKLHRIVILMNPKNKASEKVAKKSGYKKEGKMKEVIKDFKSNTFRDSYLYAKVK
jgi:ribosomal-protein-alanine N-acetyltransferase